MLFRPSGVRHALRAAVLRRATGVATRRARPVATRPGGNGKHLVALGFHVRPQGAAPKNDHIARNAPLGGASPTEAPS